jgi:hypothetical protein
VAVEPVRSAYTRSVLRSAPYAAARALPKRRSGQWTSLFDASLLLLAGVVILIPTWLVLPPDDEDFYKEIAATVYQSNEVFSGRYPFWDPLVGFGVPQPLSQTLVFHPFLFLVQITSVGTAIGIFYQLQIWIGILSIWGVARMLGAGRIAAAACALTYALSSPTIIYLKNFWPVIFVQWTLAPLLLLLLIKLLDAQERHARATYAVALGLCVGLFVLDGHAGLVPDFTVGFVAFLVGAWRRIGPVLPWLGVTLAVAGSVAASRVYDIALEASKSTAPRHQDVESMNAAQLFVYPIGAPRAGDRGVVAIGGVFFLLAAFAMFYRGLTGRYVNALRIGAGVTFVFFFVPVETLTIRSANYFVADPFVIFAVLLAVLGLRTLWTRFPRTRPGLVLAVVLQIAAMAGGFAPFFRSNLSRAIDYGSGKHVPSLRSALKNQPIYAFLERRSDHARTRAYLAPGAENRLFRSLTDYEFAAWPLHGLRLANGIFKGIELNELTPAKKKLKGEIRGDSRVADSALTLDVLGIGYVLATPHDRVPPSLRHVMTFRLEKPEAQIDVYQNPGRWADAVVLRATARGLGTLPRRPGCDEPGLLCADFRRVVGLQEDARVGTSEWQGATLHATFASGTVPRTLLLSQIYRPGWQAKLSTGETVRGYRLLGGFTGFDLPPRATSAAISFKPTSRIILTSLTWVSILTAVLFLIGATAGRSALAAVRRARAANTVRRERQR